MKRLIAIAMRFSFSGMAVFLSQMAFDAPDDAW
jgi:hypothetical protein